MKNVVFKKNFQLEIIIFNKFLIFFYFLNCLNYFKFIEKLDKRQLESAEIESNKLVAPLSLIFLSLYLNYLE
jgi:hypothetical protein